MNTQNMNNSTGVINKKNKRKRNKFEYNNEFLCNEDNIQDNLIVPIEFQTVDYPTYLSMGQDSKLCLNLFKSEDSLHQRIEELEKELKEKSENIKSCEDSIKESDEEILKISKNINNTIDIIQKMNKKKLSQEKQISEGEGERQLMSNVIKMDKD